MLPAVKIESKGEVRFTISYLIVIMSTTAGPNKKKLYYYGAIKVIDRYTASKLVIECYYWK